MLFRRLVVWNSTILVFLTAVFVWYNLTSTQKIVEEEVYNSFYTSMDTGAAELASVFRDARNLTLELCANTSVQRALRQDDAAWQDEEQKIQAARQSSENLTRFFPTFNAEIYGLDTKATPISKITTTNCKPLAGMLILFLKWNTRSSTAVPSPSAVTNHHSNRWHEKASHKTSL